MFSGEFLDISMDLIRREIEYCDTSPLIVSTHSVAGGTGSGLGTRVSECVRDEFPDTTLVNIAVLPYHFGEVVVQYYNTILCLSKILSSSHGIILYENEVAFDICRKTRGIERPSLADINNTMASQLSSVIVPKRLFESSSISSTNINRTILSSFDNDISHLCCHSHFKLLDVKSVPQTFDRSKEYTFDSWRSLIRSISRMQLYGSYSDRVVTRSTSTSTSTSSNASASGNLASKTLSPPAKSQTIDSVSVDSSVSIARSSASVGNTSNTCKTLAGIIIMWICMCSASLFTFIFCYIFNSWLYFYIFIIFFFIVSAVMTCRGSDVLDSSNRREISEIHSAMECSNLIKSSLPVRVCYDEKLSNGYQRSISLGKYPIYLWIDVKLFILLQKYK